MTQSFSVKAGCKGCKKPMYGRIILQAEMTPKRGDSISKIKCPLCHKPVQILNVF